VIAPLPRPLVVKEGRALAPIWLAAAMTIILSVQAGALPIGLFAFAVGAAALGAFSIGHEYAHRTLTTLLALPLSRSSLLLSKLVVLAPMLVLLTIVAALTLLRADGIERVLGEGIAGTRWRLSVVLLTPVLGLCIAPWLTIVCRSAVAGLVFTLAIPAALWIAGQIARVMTVGFMVDPLAYGPALTLMTAGLIAIGIVAAVNGRALFVRLEALDAPRDIAPLAVKRSTRTAADAAESHVSVPYRPRRHHPLVMLAHKEVRLHLLAFAVAALYTVGWIAMRLTRTDAFIAGQSFQSISELYGVFIAMLVGAVATAEERALGTTEWQTLQPWAYWKQWTVKITVVVAVAMTLGLALPIALEAAFPLIGDSGDAGLTGLYLLIYYYGYGSGAPLAVPFVAFLGLYVSTLCSSGLRALLLTLPSFALAALYSNVVYAVNRIEHTMIIDRYGPGALGPKGVWWQRLSTATSADFRTAFAVDQWISTIALGGFVVLILMFALRNSRSAERGAIVARRQLPVVLAYVVLAGVLGRAVPAYLEWWLLTH
jgi:hypothetical protein